MCCWPTHLFLGTASDNMQDAARKGRWKRNKNEPPVPATLAAVREREDEGKPRLPTSPRPWWLW